MKNELKFNDRLSGKERDLLAKNFIMANVPVKAVIYNNDSDGSTVTRSDDKLQPCAEIYAAIRAVAEDMTGGTITPTYKDSEGGILYTGDAVTLPDTVEGNVSLIELDVPNNIITAAYSISLSIVLPNVASGTCEISLYKYPQEAIKSATEVLSTNTTLLQDISRLSDALTSGDSSLAVLPVNSDAFYKEDLISKDDGQAASTLNLPAQLYPYNKLLCEFKHTSGTIALKVYGSNAPTLPANVTDMTDISENGITILNGETPAASYSGSIAFEVYGWKWVVINLIASDTNVYKLYCRGLV